MTTNPKKSTLPLLLLASALVTGCAATPQPKAAGDDDFLGYISYNRGGRRVPVVDVTRVTTRELVSPDLQVSRVNDGFRGVAGRAIIELRPEGDKVLGNRGGLPIALHLTHEGDLLLARGLYGGQLVELRFPRETPAPAPRRTADGKLVRTTAESSSPEMIAAHPVVLNSPGMAIGGRDTANETVARMFSRLPENEAVALLAVVYLR